MSLNLGDLVKSLYIAFENKQFDACYQLLPKIKLELLKNSLLLPNFDNHDETYINDLNITKGILEIAALTTIYLNKFDEFTNYFTQLRVFYFNNKSNKLFNQLTESNNKSKLISLYLLILLSQSEITKFHSELEFFDNNIINMEDDELLSYPIKVDRWLMEGSYQKAWNILLNGLQVPEFDVFSKSLMNTIRLEIAQNTELSYKQLPLTNIKTLLFFDDEKVTENFALERGWLVKNAVVYFNNNKNENDNNNNHEKEIEFEINNDDEELELTQESTDLIDRTMDYAIKLETIV